MTPQNASALDPRLLAVREALSSLGKELEPVPNSVAGITHAAVSVILREGTELEILLIRRAEADGDPWSGHMAFPGGRRSPGDANLRQTAIRETWEETGIRLNETGRFLGRLEALSPSTFRLPPISIFPFVFSVPQDTEARVASVEVDEIVWSPLTTLLDPGARTTAPIDLGHTTREFPCFRVEDRVVWGLTYRILTGFFELLHEA